jgi:hypothetical protein
VQVQVPVGKRIISVTIFGIQSESLGKRLDLHHLLLDGHDNPTDIFRKFLPVVDSPDDQCAPKLEGREQAIRGDIPIDH